MGTNQSKKRAFLNVSGAIAAVMLLGGCSVDGVEVNNKGTAALLVESPFKCGDPMVMSSSEAILEVPNMGFGSGSMTLIIPLVGGLAGRENPIEVASGSYQVFLGETWGISVSLTEQSQRMVGGQLEIDFDAAVDGYFSIQASGGTTSTRDLEGLEFQVSCQFSDMSDSVDTTFRQTVNLI